MIMKFIRTSKEKIVNITIHKAILFIAIFFYLVLFLIRIKEKNFGQILEDGKHFHVLLNFPAAAIAEEAINAANAAKEGAEAAKAAKTTADAAKTANEASKTGEAAKNMGQVGSTAKDASGAGSEAPKAAAPTSKGGSSNPTPNMNSEVGQNRSPSSPFNDTKNGSKDGFGDSLRKPQPPSSSSMNSETNKDNKDDTGFSDSSQAVAEGAKKAANEVKKDATDAALLAAEIAAIPVTGGASAVVGIATNPLVWKVIKFILIIILALVFLAAAAPLLIAQQVSPTSTIVEGVGGNTTTVNGTSSGGGGSPATTQPQSVGSKIGTFFEKLKNALTGNGYYTDEESLYAKIKDEYQSYYQQYGIEIDVPTIAATLFYDVDSFGTEDKNGDGLPDINSNYIERTNNVSKITSFMLQKFETTFSCTKEESEGTTLYKKVFVQTVPVDNDVNKSSNVCSEETVGQSIYEYNYEVDLDKYYDKLIASDVLQSIYGDKAETDIQRRSLAGEIKAYRENWMALYGQLEEDQCPSSGTITSDILSEMKPPVHEPYTITSYFGYREGEFSGFHEGIDVVPSSVVNIFAAADGIVSRVYNEVQGGNVIEILHDFDGVKYVTQYAHLKDNSILVKVGDTVTMGQPLATMGATGQVTGPHLHFQMWKYDPAVNGRPTKDNLINPVNLFEAASNYIYQCKAASNGSDCSVEGSIANIAQQKSYNFNIIRAIVQYESSASSSDLLVLGLKPEDLKKRLDAVTTPEAQTVAAQINFDDDTVNVDGTWESFDGSGNQIARHKVVDLIGSVNVDVFNDIAMGIGQIKGSNHSIVGYSTAKEMYDALSKGKYAQVSAMVAYLEHEGSAVVNVLKNIGNMSDSELDGAVQTLVDAYRPGGPEAWKENVLSNYRKFRDDPNSKIQNYIGQCSVVTNPEWEVCSTYENKSGCKSNLSKYKNVSMQLLNSAGSTTGKAILTNALSLWGYVRYCGARTPDYQTRCDPAHYGPVHIYYGQGFVDKWKIVHTYVYNGHQYTAGVAGLDCGGFVTWVYNQTFKTKFTYVLNGPCTSDTQYTTSHVFPKTVEGLSALHPGDGVCYYGDGRHTLIFMGTIDGRYYFIHTGSGTLGVMIFDLSAQGLLGEHYSDYFTAK